jgi:hypothetical protein
MLPRSTRVRAPRGPAGQEPTSPGESDERTRLPAGLLLPIALFATVAPYLGPEVPVRRIVEFVDHVVPGVVVLGVSLFWIYRRRFEFFTAGLAVLAGLWMFVTHVPLVVDAAQGRVGWGGALWMFVPSALVLALTAWSAMLAWFEEE